MRGLRIGVSNSCGAFDRSSACARILPSPLLVDYRHAAMHPLRDRCGDPQGAVSTAAEARGVTTAMMRVVLMLHCLPKLACQWFRHAFSRRREDWRLRYRRDRLPLHRHRGLLARQSHRRVRLEDPATRAMSPMLSLESGRSNRRAQPNRESVRGQLRNDRNIRGICSIRYPATGDGPRRRGTIFRYPPVEVAADEGL